MTRTETVKRMNEVYKNIKLAETSGELIRALIMKGGLSDEQIIAANKKVFKDSGAKSSDVSWNRGFLKRAGIKFEKPARAPSAKKANGKTAPKAAKKVKGKGAKKAAKKAAKKVADKAMGAAEKSLKEGMAGLQN